MKYLSALVALSLMASPALAETPVTISPAGVAASVTAPAVTPAAVAAPVVAEAKKTAEKTAEKAAEGVKKELTPQQKKMGVCSHAAKEQGLKGEQRKAFLKQCLSKKPTAETVAPAVVAPAVAAPAVVAPAIAAPAAVKGQ